MNNFQAENGVPIIIIKNFNGPLKCFDGETGFEENHSILSTFLLRYGTRRFENIELR